MRIVFIGVDHEFSITPLRAIAQRHSIIGVIESLPVDCVAKASRLSTFAEREKVPYIAIGRGLARPVEFLKWLRPSVIVVSGMAGLLREEEFNAAAHGAINLHPSLLPAYRGPEPFFWQAHAADLNGGVTVHRIDAGIDTGDILLQRPFAISAGMCFGDISRMAIASGATAICESLDAIADGRMKATSQRDLPCPFYARRVQPQDMILDWSWPVQRLWHFLRAAPYERRPVFIKPTQGAGWTIGDLEKRSGDAAAGTVAQDARGYYLSHHQGRIRLQSPAGKLRRLYRQIKSAVDRS